MTTAAEYLDRHCPFGILIKSAVEKAINEARKDAIEECAKRADVSYVFSGFEDKVEQDTIAVDKQSILSLISELK